MLLISLFEYYERRINLILFLFFYSIKLLYTYIISLCFGLINYLLIFNNTEKEIDFQSIDWRFLFNGFNSS